MTGTNLQMGGGRSSVGLFGILLVLFATHGKAQVPEPTVCPTPFLPNASASFLGAGGDSMDPDNCGGFNCEFPELQAGPLFQVEEGCDPNDGPCDLEIEVQVLFPGNTLNDSTGVHSKVYWFNQDHQAPSTNGGCWRFPFPFGNNCAPTAFCGEEPFELLEETGRYFLDVAGVSCADLLDEDPPTDSLLQLHQMAAISCNFFGSQGCVRRLNVPVDLTESNLAREIGCKQPPMDGCPNDRSCRTCNSSGPGGAAGPAGGGGGFSGAGPGETGPGARLSYLAGGAGGDDWPGTPAWRTELGLYWSHDYAERIIQDPDDSRVWLITQFATFRKFTGLSGGTYGSISPSDEYRTLHRTGGGWELVSLDGTVQAFNGLGRWISTTDRFGNAKIATYNVMGQLETVDFPDGRSETFAYHPTGKLASITKVGVTATDSRAWSYSWTDDLLDRIDRPDGTALEFFYEDLNFLGYLTRVEKVGTAMGRRVESAWEYDAFGNVAYMWWGDADRLGANAIDTWEYVFDNPLNPTETIVTDPLGNASTYTIGRDENSNKPRLEGLSGDCPSCSLGPNSTIAYNDMDHPLRATKETDARGHETVMTYDNNGQVLTRTEAMGEAEERTTTWVYNSTFPALVDRIIQESVEGAPNERLTVMNYNAEGALTERRIEGFERIDGVATPFAYATDYTPTPEGQTLNIDPPGYLTSDVTSFVYDPARGSLLAESRTDPLVGTTEFDYDDYNRRTEVTDPNGGKTITAFDMADRVTTVTQNGAPDPNDPNPALLTTTNVYNEFGDLERTILPKLNVIEYSYDFAGRLESIERKPDAATPKERTFYTLDAIGNRTQEDLQRWTGVAWETRSSTEFVYSNRCQLDEVRYPDGSITEYAYDCEGNLEKTWDANHPSNNQTEMASTMYTYDALDRLTQVSQRWGGSGPDPLATTQYLYDVQDHLTQVIDAESTPTVYQYSDRDLLTQETSLVSGSTDHKYNEHGELVETKDARQIIVTRTVDELDRVTQVSYPTPNLNTTYTYDDPAVAFSKGRLTQISRHGSAIDYAYDRFGRLTQDGDLSFGYDDNSNRSSVGYPEGVMATYTHDFADRELSLEVERPGQPVQTIASGATYEPSGPVSSLTLGNGLTETRAFNQRYFPTDINLAGASTLLDWTYATDNVGNILGITDNQNPANNRGYAYQDFQYFLTSGNGPWGNQTWTYDQIGNRLSEVRDALPQEDYVYLQNGSSGNTAVLDEIQVAAVTLRDYQYGVAGHLERVTAGANEILYTSDAEGRLSTITRQAGDARTDFLYDGRSFLTMSAANTANGIFEDGFETGDVRCWTLAVGGGGDPGPTKCDPQPLTRPTYSSDGLLMAVDKDESQPTELAKTYFYFAGRPVAQLDVDGGGAASYTWLTTDHLGTPVVATNAAGVDSWSGGFEPFGGDFSSASSSGVDLRFPGQWDDASWESASVGSEQYQNVHRWYLEGIGRYSKMDPLGLLGGLNPMIYASNRSLFLSDPLGLAPKPGRGKWCDERSVNFELCDCSRTEAVAVFAETLDLRKQFCNGTGISNQTRTVDPVESGDFRRAGSVEKGRPWYDPTVVGDDPCLIACTCVHEENHAEALRNPRLEQFLLDGVPSEAISDWTECMAYSDEATCLAGFIRNIK